MVERPGTANLEKQENLEKLADFIKSVAERYRGENVPIDDRGRIDMAAYSTMYDDVDSDVARVENWQADASENPGERILTDGEQFEMLAFSIMAKNLGNDFVITRSALHDDWVNGVDTLLLDRKTGNLVCAFDEVGDTTGSAYEAKLAKVREHNLEGGASLKYGIGMAGKDTERKVIRSSASNIPIFYIALPKGHIQKGMAEFIPDEKKQSDFEKKLFSYFSLTLAAQTQSLELELEGEKLNLALKNKLSAFKKVLNDLNSGREKK